jgi:hypothetical protein
MKPKKLFTNALATCLFIGTVSYSQADTTTKICSEVTTNKPFKKVLTLKGITFTITSPNNSSINKVTITPKALKGSNAPVVVEADGIITGAEIDDLNVDGCPDLFIYVTSAGSGSYGSVIAYTTNKNKSLSPIYLTPVSDNPEESKGYMGHDEFAVVEGSFIQRFNLYDDKGKKTKKMRQIQYKLKAGEAGFKLEKYNATDF